ncbi:Rho GTPase-activating protein 1, partial [Mucuna pruriens]
MTEVLQLPSSSSCSSRPCGGLTPNDGSHQSPLINAPSVEQEQGVPQSPLDLEVEEEKERDRERDQLSILTLLIDTFRKSLIGCSTTSGDLSMEIGWPSNVRHVAHVTFDRFHGFLGLPVEFEPEVPRRPPSASASVFGVSTESMQLSFDARGNSVPTILLLMQRQLYALGGLQAEGIFRINAENSQEEFVREQLNRGIVPDGIDVHCLAGLIKAWFRELPTGVLDPLSPEQMMQSQSEEECAQLVRLLPQTEATLLDWVINLMADVAQLEHFNKMNAHNVATVFAPNMTQMVDPLTALMYAVQVMNFLKTLVMKTLREREESMIKSNPVSDLNYFGDDEYQSSSQLTLQDGSESGSDFSEEDDKVFVDEEPSPQSHPSHLIEHGYETESGCKSLYTATENIITRGNRLLVNTCPCSYIVSQMCSLTNGIFTSLTKGDQANICKSKSLDLSYSNKVTCSKKVVELPVKVPAEKNRRTSITGLINTTTDLAEAWPRLMMNIHCFGRNLITASSSLPHVQLPVQREVHFWYVLPDEVKNTNLLNQYLEILSPCEKENIFRIHGEQLKKRAILARALTNCQIDPKSLKFRKNNYGKPEVDWQYADDWSLPPLHFNISHTSSLIACGVTVGSPIGIDVEEKQRKLKNDVLAFAQRFFSPHEIEMLTHIADPELRLQEFIKLWTLKEAYVKALGKGFSGSPFKTFTVRLRDHRKRDIHAPSHTISKAPDITVEPSNDLKNPSSNWQFVLLELAGSHYAAICIEQDNIDTGNESIPINLTLRKTIPNIEDECISETDSAVVIGGFTRLLAYL